MKLTSNPWTSGQAACTNVFLLRNYDPYACINDTKTSPPPPKKKPQKNPTNKQSKNKNKNQKPNTCIYASLLKVTESFVLKHN